MLAHLESSFSICTVCWVLRCRNERLKAWTYSTVKERRGNDRRVATHAQACKMPTAMPYSSVCAYRSQTGKLPPAAT
jgi:hypothetical protein